MLFKVIEIGTNWKYVCDFILVINSNWHLIPCHSEVIAASLLFKFWTLCVFEPPFGGLRDNVRCSSWARCVNWFFARCYDWVATSEKRSFVWYKNLDRSFFRVVTMHAFDRQTDGRTDRILIARPRLHCMQRGKTTN